MLLQHNVVLLLFTLLLFCYTVVLLHSRDAPVGRTWWLMFDTVPCPPPTSFSTGGAQISRAWV